MKTFKINIFLFSFLTSFHLYSHKSLPERITALHEVTRKLIRYTLPIPETHTSIGYQSRLKWD